MKLSTLGLYLSEVDSHNFKTLPRLLVSYMQLHIISLQYKEVEPDKCKQNSMIIFTTAASIRTSCEDSL